MVFNRGKILGPGDISAVIHGLFSYADTTDFVRVYLLTTYFNTDFFHGSNLIY